MIFWGFGEVRILEILPRLFWNKIFKGLCSEADMPKRKKVLFIGFNCVLFSFQSQHNK